MLIQHQPEYNHGPKLVYVKHSGSECSEGGLELFVCLLYSGNAEDRGAVREAFYLVAVGQSLGQERVVVCCIYVSLTTFVVVFNVDSFFTVLSKPRDGR